jgi:hypothetical protein
MRGPLLTRLFSATLILLISSGGGGLPVLDGLFFHSRDRGPEVVRPHYEANGGCHSDGCAIRSTAHLSRLGPAVHPVGQISAAAEVVAAPRMLPLLQSQPLSGQPLSRAPPRFG